MRYGDAQKEIAATSYGTGKTVQITDAGLTYDRRKVVGICRHPHGMIWDVYADENGQNGETLISCRT